MCIYHGMFASPVLAPVMSTVLPSIRAPEVQCRVVARVYSLTARSRARKDESDTVASCTSQY